MKLPELEKIFQTVTGLTFDDVLDLSEEEKMRRINEHVKPRDVFEEAVREMTEPKP